MKCFLILILVCFANLSFGATNYIFEVDYDTDELKSSYTTTNEPLKYIEITRAGKKEPEKRYSLSVTPAQYAAGWAALDPAVKAAKKDEAKEEASDPDKKQSKMEKALSKAVLEEVNVVRAANGLPAINYGQWKKKIKDQCDALP